MVALYKISANLILQNWGNIVPQVFSIPGMVDVHCPSADWAYGDYKFLPVVYEGQPTSQYSQQVAVNETVVNGPFANGQLIVTKTFQDPPLSDIQTNLCSQVDNKAEQIRLNYITAGSGQMGVYLIKFNEAKAVLADPNPQAVNYPLTASAIGLPGIASLQDAANVITTQYTQWVQVAATIESIRLTGKANIMAANNITSVVDAYQTITWEGL